MKGENGNVSDDAESMCQSTNGCIGSSVVVTTVNILVMNANVLLGRDPERLYYFRVLLASRNPKPDIIAVQELGGTSAEEEVRSEFRGGLWMYRCVFSQEVMLYIGTNQAGGGIMLLYKLDQFRCDVIVPPLNIKGAALLDGYVRTFCLWRKKFAYMLPLLVTVAYVPPVRRYWRELRKSALSAIPLIVK